MVMAHQPMKSSLIGNAKKIPTAANWRIAAAPLDGAELDPLIARTIKMMMLMIMAKMIMTMIILILIVVTKKMANYVI